MAGNPPDQAGKIPARLECVVLQPVALPTATGDDNFPLAAARPFLATGRKTRPLKIAAAGRGSALRLTLASARALAGLSRLN